MQGLHRPSAAAAGSIHNAKPQIVRAQTEKKGGAFSELPTPRLVPNGHNLARGKKHKEELPVGESTPDMHKFHRDPLYIPTHPWGPRGQYLVLEEETTFLLKLAERVKATSISGTSTTTCGLCTKPRPLCTPTRRRRSRISRPPPSSGPHPWKRHRQKE